MNSVRQGSHEAVVDIVGEFTEAAVHTLLQARRVYPQDIFERRRKYGVPVWMSRHPELNDYISEVLLRAKSLMAQGVVRKVIVCFFQEGSGLQGDQRPVERVAFDIHIDRDGGDGDGDDVGEEVRQRDQARLLNQASLQEVEDQLRSALLQIQKSSAHLPTRQGCTFALHIEAHEEGRVDMHEESQDGDVSSPVRSALTGGKWLLADRNEQEVLAEPRRRQLVPIKSVRGQGLRIDLSTEMGDCCTF